MKLPAYILSALGHIDLSFTDCAVIVELINACNSRYGATGCIAVYPEPTDTPLPASIYPPKEEPDSYLTFNVSPKP